MAERDQDSHQHPAEASPSIDDAPATHRPGPLSDTTGTTPPTPAAGTSLDIALIGRLPCIICGYELQGLSIRGTCPECGTLVRATILHRVDPQAEEFVPLYSAKAVAAGLILWLAGALIVALTGWLRRAGEWADSFALVRDPREWLGTLAVAGVIVSVLGALAIVRPTRETKPWKSVLALIGVLAYIPMLWAIQRLARLDAMAPAEPFSTSTMPEREVARLVLSGSIILACLGLRNVARDMAKRSLALRTGRVDRQTLLAIAVAATAGAFGDAIRLWTALNDHTLSQNATHTLNIVGGSIVMVAAVFVTLGIAGAMGDSFRIAQAIRRPGPTMRDLIGLPSSSKSRSH